MAYGGRGRRDANSDAHRARAASQRDASSRTCLPPKTPHKPVLREQARLLEPRWRSNRRIRAIDWMPTRLGAARRADRRATSRDFVALHPFAGDPRRCVPLDEWMQRGARARCARTHGALDRDDRRARRAPATTITASTGYYIDRLRRRLADRDGGRAVARDALRRTRFRAAAFRRRVRRAGRRRVRARTTRANFPQGVGPSRHARIARRRRNRRRTMLREIDALLVSSAQ